MVKQNVTFKIGKENKHKLNVKECVKITFKQFNNVIYV